MYAELNTKSDYCHECGFDGEIIINELTDLLISDDESGNSNREALDKIEKFGIIPNLSKFCLTNSE